MISIPKRWEIALLLNSGIVIVYCLRVNMSIGVQDIRDELNWSEAEKGVVLSAFYWGYAIGAVPASKIAQVYGAKLIFGLSILIPSILTLFVPVACRTSIYLALACRCFLGLCESATFPALFQFYPLWIPLEEKQLLIAVINSGVYIGEILGFATSGYMTSIPSTVLVDGLIVFGGWDAIFYLFGCMGVIWYPIWVMYAVENPETHPHITKSELDLIRRGKGVQDYLPLINTYEPDAVCGDCKKDCVERASTTPEFQFVEDNDKLKVEHSDTPAQDMCCDNVYSINEDASDNTTAANPLLHSLLSNQCETYSSNDIVEDSVGLSPPWMAILSHPVHLAIMLQAWTYGWINFTLLSELPSYLTDELGFNLSSAGVLSTLPYVLLFVSTLGSSNLFTWLELNSKNWSVSKTRRTAQEIGLLGAGLGLVICGFVSAVNVPIAFVCMVMAQGCLGVCVSGYMCSYLDIAPYYSGLLNSISVSIGAVAGIVGPIVVALVTDAFHGSWGWNFIFIISCVQCIISVLVWRAYQCSNIVPELNTPVRHR